MKRRAKRPTHKIIPKRKNIRLGEIAAQFSGEVWNVRGEAERTGDASFVFDVTPQNEMIEILMGVLARHVGKKIMQHEVFPTKALPHICYPIKGEEHLMKFWHRPQWPKASKPNASEKNDICDGALR